MPASYWLKARDGAGLRTQESGHGQEESERVSLCEVCLRVRWRIRCSVCLRRGLRVQGDLPLRERLSVRDREVAV